MLEIVKKYLIETLNHKRMEIVPETPPEYQNIIAESVHASLNIISLSDAMYHDVEHTCLVTLCGQEIFCGKKVKEGNLNSKDWLHFTISLLFHDIGYVKNILPNDESNYQVINESGEKVQIESSQTDASLTPYHVERGKMYINQRSWPEYVDKKILMDLISFTQFPQPDRREPDGEDEKKLFSLANLVGSADLIGQLADPMYDEKIPRLFYEFKESGTSDKMGYKSSQDLRVGFPSFFINFVRPNIQDAVNYLQITEEGRSWIAGLNYHVFSQSHKAAIEKSGLSLITKLADLNISRFRTDEFIETILESVCDYSGWPVGHAYKAENVKNDIRLRSTGVWYTTIPKNELKEFIRISEDYEFKSGEGLPGRVHQVGSVQTIYDVTKDDNFPRANLAQEVGLRGAFSFPIKNGEEILYILEFFSVEPEQISPPVIELMRQLSVQISRKFIKND